MEGVVYLILFICVVTIVIIASLHQTIHELKYLNKTIIDMNIRHMKRIMREMNIQDAEAYKDINTSHLYLVRDNDKENDSEQ